MYKQIAKLIFSVSKIFSLPQNIFTVTYLNSVRQIQNLLLHLGIDCLHLISNHK
jgi:hypothetical protein